MNQKYFLNLPKTTFPMKGNLAVNELNILKKWKKINLYKLLRFKYKSNKLFIIHDGPPYANGKIHLGHALNKILKDTIIKFQSFNNYNIIFIPGWDCHGLPIELKVDNLANIIQINDHKQFRKKCKLYALSQVRNQEKDFFRLGIIADWEHKYLTINRNNQAKTIKLLAKIIKLNYIYRDYKPVYWCIKCISSLAEAEIEYKITKTLSAYILFLIDVNSIQNKKLLSLKNKNIFLLAWTTTIWTLPANVAIAINPNYNYLVICNKKYYFLIEKFLFINNNNLLNYSKNLTIVDEIIGKDLINIKYFSLFNNKKLPLIFNKNINNKEGTGIVHIAPAHGYEDYELCKKYKIKSINLINKYGNYNNNPYVPIFLKGKNINEVDTLIINFLKSKNYFLESKIINHKYPYCWRHKYPVIFRSTPQWFINMNINNIKNKCINNIKKIIWIPFWGKDRMIEMIKTRPDWCISRQRLWGIPLPLFINKFNHTIHPKMNLILTDLIKKIKKFGINFWWKINKQKYLNKKELNFYDKVIDIIDVWFDSGATFYTVLNKYNIDLFLEGNDQYRGWFMSSLILSTIINNNPPCKKIISHGFIVDENKQKMSKSLSNSLSPTKIIKKFGAEIVRLWVLSNNYTHEISISNKQLNNITIIYRRIRNTIRYILSNLYDFNVNTKFKLSKLLFIDKWIINKCIYFNQKIFLLYKNYKFHEIVKIITNFCSITLGTFYLDIVKDRLYTMSNQSLGRKSCQVTIWHILNFLLHWIAPILSFTAEESWNYLSIFINHKNDKSIFLNNWYNLSLKLLCINSNFYNIWKNLLKIKTEFSKIFEIYKNKYKLSSSLKIKVIIFLPYKIIQKFKFISRELSFLFLTNKVTLINNKKLDKIDYGDDYYYINNKLSFILKNIKFTKCYRCWHYKLSVNNNNKYKLYLCTRCIINLNHSNFISKGEKRFYF